MVNVKEAVKNAAEFLTDLFPDAYETRLEEVETSESGADWNVVLSFWPSAKDHLTGTPRLFKTIKISRASGDPEGLRIWK